MKRQREYKKDPDKKAARVKSKGAKMQKKGLKKFDKGDKIGLETQRSANKSGPMKDKIEKGGYRGVLYDTKKKEVEVPGSGKYLGRGSATMADKWDMAISDRLKSKGYKKAQKGQMMKTGEAKNKKDAKRIQKTFRPNPWEKDRKKKAKKPSRKSVKQEYKKVNPKPKAPKSVKQERRRRAAGVGAFLAGGAMGMGSKNEKAVLGGAAVGAAGGMTGVLAGINKRKKDPHDEAGKYHRAKSNWKSGKKASVKNARRKK